MNLTPFRFRPVADQILLTNEVGDYGIFSDGVVERLFADTLTVEERQRLQDLSILVEETEEWRIVSLMRRARSRHRSQSNRLSYLIVIPTLRCDLSCSYCQVSRAPLNAKGFDWTNDHLVQFERFIEAIDSDHLKLEFQGGEPTVRPDLLRQIIDTCTRHFKTTEFVICTNLTRITPVIDAVFARDDVVISTSIDGPLSVMTANRTSADAVSNAVFKNFEYILKTYGPEKVSALPTVTEKVINDPEGLIDFYVSLGFQSIFLRPVNFMGFARKRHSDLSQDHARWSRFYRAALDHIVEINKKHYFEEFYLSLLVRSIFGGLQHGFVDLRSPSRFAADYCVIDYDGTFYPTDEARMLSRTRSIDLNIGNLGTGFNIEKVNQLNANAINQVHPDCIHCAYMPYCGVDIIDDFSRYGRADLPKHDTWFCRRQTNLFDLIFDKVAYREMPYLAMFLKWIYRRADPPPTYELFGD